MNKKEYKMSQKNNKYRVNKKHTLNGSLTVEATYLSVFIYLSILLLIFLTLSIYNVSILTSNAYLVLLEKSNCSGIENEKLEQDLFDQALTVLQEKIVAQESFRIETKTSFNELSIIYSFITRVPIEDYFRKVFGKKNWEYRMETNMNRVRIEESMRLMKVICGGEEE